MAPLASLTSVVAATRGVLGLHEAILLLLGAESSRWSCWSRIERAQGAYNYVVFCRRVEANISPYGDQHRQTAESPRFCLSKRATRKRSLAQSGFSDQPSSRSSIVFAPLSQTQRPHKPLAGRSDNRIGCLDLIKAMEFAETVLIGLMTPACRKAPRSLFFAIAHRKSKHLNAYHPSSDIRSCRNAGSLWP